MKLRKCSSARLIPTSFWTDQRMEYAWHNTIHDKIFLQACVARRMNPTSPVVSQVSSPYPLVPTRRLLCIAHMDNRDSDSFPESSDKHVETAKANNKQLRQGQQQDADEAFDNTKTTDGFCLLHFMLIPSRFPPVLLYLLTHAYTHTLVTLLMHSHTRAPRNLRASVTG